jgi:hypothetical protein
LVIPSSVSFCDLRKADLLLHEPALHCNELLAISLKILLYLSYKLSGWQCGYCSDDSLNISYQADNVDIAQMIVFWVLASCKVIVSSNVWRFPQFPCSGWLNWFQAVASTWIWRQHSEDYHLIILNAMCSNLYSVKLPSALNFEIKLTVVPATTAFTTVFHNESSWKEGHTNTLVFSFLITPVCFIITFTDRQKKNCNSDKTNASQHFKYLFIVHNKNCSLINKMCYFLEQPSLL